MYHNCSVKWKNDCVWLTGRAYFNMLYKQLLWKTEIGISVLTLQTENWTPFLLNAKQHFYMRNRMHSPNINISNDYTSTKVKDFPLKGETNMSNIQIFPLQYYFRYWCSRATDSARHWSEFLATDPETLVRFKALPDFLRSLKRGPFTLVSTTEDLLGRKSSGSGLETSEYGRRDQLCWALNTLYPQKLALTSPTSSGRFVGIVRSRTKAMEFMFVCLLFRDIFQCSSF
jgi:hypothetical protein